MKTGKLNYFLEDKIFYFAIVLSIIAHFLTIYYLSLADSKILKKVLKPIEVTYQNIKPKEVKKEKAKPKNLEMTPQDIELLKNVKIIDRKIENPAIDTSIKDVTRATETFKLDEKLTPSVDTFGISRKVSIPVFQSEKITNSKYIGYQDSVRRKIHFIVSQHVKNQNVKASKVYLTFSLLSNGQLKDVQVIESRSNASDYLKDISLKSIKEASPFSPFPTSLNYPELTYNVEIEFKEGE